jgi:hypothetical protein
MNSSPEQALVVLSGVKREFVPNKSQVCPR